MNEIVPAWVFDWTGSILVGVSLLYLIPKKLAYWHFSNASLLPYFILFLAGEQFMLAGLQLAYLIFGIHGYWLWHLEQRRDQQQHPFNELFWYNLGWVLTLLIFAYTAYITGFSNTWAWLQFAIVSLSLLANWATTRKWVWSWYVWLPVNLLQSVYFWHYEYLALFLLQFVLFSLSLRGLVVWRREREIHA
ncbi:nicotinamide mononucleotide transporter [Permianibacter sp. IMCC34836]|uniref:nicotinamide mononucleotide transporter family protein n=1 Tax=Permianibacter fluminis TaxID=2738515 RepID=UPI001555D094|nr:nicotinamide mononucleotide transporter family protein [Permianibacter fluminis]NQD35985.1 nicotinamide mononucleotide transporter [Permianibacter fluminis]